MDILCFVYFVFICCLGAKYHFFNKSFHSFLLNRGYNVKIDSRTLEEAMRVSNITFILKVPPFLVRQGRFAKFGCRNIVALIFAI